MHVDVGAGFEIGQRRANGFQTESGDLGGRPPFARNPNAVRRRTGGDRAAGYGLCRKGAGHFDHLFGHCDRCRFNPVAKRAEDLVAAAQRRQPLRLRYVMFEQPANDRAISRDRLDKKKSVSSLAAKRAVLARTIK